MQRAQICPPVLPEVIPEKNPELNLTAPGIPSPTLLPLPLREACVGSGLLGVGQGLVSVDWTLEH